MDDKTPTDATTLNGGVFVVDTPEPDPVPAPFVSLFDRYKAWMAGKPWYYHVLAVALATLIGGVVGHYFPEAKPYIPSPVLFGQVDPSAALPAVGATLDEMDTQARVGEGRRIVAERMRHRVERELMRSGFKLVGGNPTPLPEWEAKEQAAKLTQRMIAEAGRDVGAVGFVGDGPGGGILAWLRAVFLWIAEHPEQVEAWLKALLSLLIFL